MEQKQRKIIHIDMDCFYAAVEMRDNAKLRHKPIAVGGDSSQRGVVCTANYQARQFGVRSAMPAWLAKRLCPELVMLPVNFVKYRQESQAIREIFSHYTALYEPLSLDEAFLDVSHSQDYHGSATLIAQAIREEIRHNLHLTASAGVAPNKLLAKIASDWKKPDGLFAVTPDSVADFMRQLPVERLHGVGKVTAKKLHDLNIYTCKELQQLSKESLVTHFGVYGGRLYSHCRGVDDRPVQISREAKSVSVERTFSQDLQTTEQCLAALPELLQQLKRRLEKHDKKIHKLCVKVKFLDFQQTSAECVKNSLSLDTFEQLFLQCYQRQQKAVRLLGLGCGFVQQPQEMRQLSLFDCYL